MKNSEDSTDFVTSEELQVLKERLAGYQVQLAEQQARVARLEEQLARAIANPVPGGTFWVPAAEAALRIGCSIKTLGERRRAGLIPRNCWAKENARSYTYRSVWIEQARKSGIPTAYNVFRIQR